MNKNRMDVFSAGVVKWIQVVSESFEDYEPGTFTEGYNAIRELYYPKKEIRQGGWEEISTHHSFPKHNVDWVIEKRGENKVLRQKGINCHNKKSWKYFIKKYILKRQILDNLFFPAFVIGDCLWGDYRVKATMSIDDKDDVAGVIFRVKDSRHHYIFGLKRDSAVLLKRKHDELFKLAKRRFVYNCGKKYLLEVIVVGEHIICLINNKKIFELSDTSYSKGKVGVMTNIPMVCSNFEVYIKNNTLLQYNKKHKRHSGDSKKIEDRNPQMQLWKRIQLEYGCSGRSIRFGDLTGDGTIDLLIAHGKPLVSGNNYNMISFIYALDLNGNILWKYGEPYKERKCVASDLAFQIYDIDNDGCNEVVCTSGFFLQVINGMTGEIKMRIPTPRSVPPYNKFPQIIGDAIAICNLSGQPCSKDILLKDRYSKIWAYNNKLELLWEYHCKKGEMGHFPFVQDINDDGRDEVLAGYSLLNSDGKELWSLNLGDHSDAVAIINRSLDKKPIVVIAASDEGFIFADIEGRIEKRLKFGHMQTVTYAKIRDDTYGCQIATNTYWGNPGIVYILDECGDLLTSFQPSVNGSPLYPVNWMGNGIQYLLLSASPDKTGGLYDGYGRQVLSFPDDGHPVLCYYALDINKDGIDELLCWDYDNLWIYKREGENDNLHPAPQRYPALYNASNYCSYISK